MSDKYFLDTNVLVYMVDRSSPQKSSVAQTMVRDALVHRKGVISFQVAQEFINVALTKFKATMSAMELEQFFSSVLQPLITVQSSSELYKEALHVHRKNKISWYDALIVAAALEAQCAVLYSEDLQHGQTIRTLTIKNPFL